MMLLVDLRVTASNRKCANQDAFICNFGGNQGKFEKDTVIAI